MKSFQDGGRHSMSMAFAATVFAAALVGCGGAQEVTAHGPGMLAEGEETGRIESSLVALPVVPFEDPHGVGVRATTESRVVLASADAYLRYFGHPAPAAVNFAAGDAVIFYAAGVQNTGGYSAHITSATLSSTGLSLYVDTELSAPGADCVVTQALTHPFILAKVQLPKHTRWVQWTKNRVEHSCSEEPVNPCAFTLCPTNTECKVEQPQCITTPCDPIAVCVPLKPAPFCGGIAGIQCPGAGTCVDDGSDNCDPKLGGADCGGKCICDASLMGQCQTGYVADNSPEVCACVPEAPAPPKPGKGDPKCGDTVCENGTVCCNASCGICVPPGGSCIQMVCQ